MFRIILCFTFLVSHHALANDNEKRCSADLKAQLVTLTDKPDTPIPPAELKTILTDIVDCLEQIEATALTLEIVGGLPAPTIGGGTQ